MLRSHSNSLARLWSYACALLLAATGCEDAGSPPAASLDSSAQLDALGNDTGDADVADAGAAELPDVEQGPASVCKPGETLNLAAWAKLHPACKGNTACKKMPCINCATFCDLCDGPYCVSETVDDSCMARTLHLQGWGAEPLIALPLATTLVQLETPEWSSADKLTLKAAPPLPEEVKWQPKGGPVQSEPLVAPVQVVGDFALFHGVSEARNGCTGMTYTSQVGPKVIAAQLLNGQLVADFFLESSADNDVKVAWLRVYQDAAGLRAVQWIQPNPKSPNKTDVRHAFPLEVAVPLLIDGSPFDWAAQL